MKKFNINQDTLKKISKGVGIAMLACSAITYLSIGAAVLVEGFSDETPLIRKRSDEEEGDDDSEIEGFEIKCDDLDAACEPVSVYTNQEEKDCTDGINLWD